MKQPWIAVALVVAIGGCFAPARTKDGREPDAGNEGSDDLLARAVSLFKAARHEECLAYCESILTERPDYEKTETVRFLAAESRYQSGDFETALLQYRRLADDFPLSRTHVVVPDRLFAIGVGLAEHPKPLLGGIVIDRRAAIEALGYLVVQYPAYERVDEAWLLLGDQHRANAEFDLAAEAYARLVSRCADSVLREEATYRIAAAFASKAKGVEYDKQPMVLAWAAARRYLAEHGETGGRFAVEARELIAEMTAAVQESERRIAEFYREREQDAGARIHRQNAEIALVVSGGATATENSVDVLHSWPVRPPWETEGAGDALRAFFAACPPLESGGAARR